MSNHIQYLWEQVFPSISPHSSLSIKLFQRGQQSKWISTEKDQSQYSCHVINLESSNLDHGKLTHFAKSKYHGSLLSHLSKSCYNTDIKIFLPINKCIYHYYYMMFSLQWIWCWLAPLHILQHPLSRSWETNLFYSPQSWSLWRIHPGGRHSRDAWNFPLLLWHIIHGVGDQRSWHNHMCLYKSQYDSSFQPFTDWRTNWRGWKPFLAVWTFDYLFLDLFNTKLIF